MEKARALDLVWRHGPRAGQSRIAATDTGLTVQEVVEAIRPALEAAGVAVTLREEELAGGEESVEVNGRDLEEILERVREGHLYCRARSRREEMAARRHPLVEDEATTGRYTEFMLRKALLLAVEGED